MNTREASTGINIFHQGGKIKVGKNQSGDFEKMASLPPKLTQSIREFGHHMKLQYRIASLHHAIDDAPKKFPTYDGQLLIALPPSIKFQKTKKAGRIVVNTEYFKTTNCVTWPIEVQSVYSESKAYFWLYYHQHTNRIVWIFCHVNIFNRPCRFVEAWKTRKEPHLIKREIKRLAIASSQEDTPRLLSKGIPLEEFQEVSKLNFAFCDENENEKEISSSEIITYRALMMARALEKFGNRQLRSFSEIKKK